MLQNVSRKGKKGQYSIEASYLASLVYHDLFDYPLKFHELENWKVGRGLKDINYLSSAAQIKKKYIFVLGREKTIAKRELNERESKRKLLIAKKATKILEKIPSIEVVTITGALAMKNASVESDIDLLIITKKDTLWITRVISFMLLKLNGFKLRRAGIKDQKDKLCLNMWIEIDSFKWKRDKRNLFTAHEILQMKPLVNKNRMFEKYLKENSWAKKYWPNRKNVGLESRQTRSNEFKTINRLIVNAMRLLNGSAYKAQLAYMDSKITNEEIKKNKAFFHPMDWSKIVLARLSKGK